MSESPEKKTRYGGRVATLKDRKRTSIWLGETDRSVLKELGEKLGISGHSNLIRMLIREAGVEHGVIGE